MKFSFCTTCMGRTPHLKETLLKNIKDNPPSKDFDVEFVVLDYNSQDGLQEWITKDPEIKPHIESGRVKYFKTDEPKLFKMSHAKNMAHRQATGEVLCNLDADNYLGEGFAEFLYKHFKANPNIVICPRARVENVKNRGYAGRIAISSENFMRLGGYDEKAFDGWGGEDPDLFIRAARAGIRIIVASEAKFFHAIENSNEERLINMYNKDKLPQELEKLDKYRASINLHNLSDHFSMYVRPVQSHKDGKFGLGTVKDIEGKSYTLGPVEMQPVHFSLKGLIELPRIFIDRRGEALMEKVFKYTKGIFVHQPDFT